MSRCLLLWGLFVCVSACAQKAPESARVAAPEWGKAIINPTAEENKKHWEQWHRQAIKHYRYKTKITCDECTMVTYNKALILPDDTRIARGLSWMIVEVREQQVISVKNIDGSPNEDFAERLRVYKTDVIEMAFQWIEASIPYKFNTQVASFDTKFGFPRYAELLPSEKGPTDVGHRIEILEFEVLPEGEAEPK